MGYAELFGDAKASYDFDIFENDIVKIEPAGRCIRIGIKDANGREFSWFEPTHPFRPRPASIQIPPQNGWIIDEEETGTERTRYIFSGNGLSYILTLTVIDPSVKPMMVRVEWE